MKRGGSRRWLLTATFALLALRVALALVRDGPLVVADEAGYLLNARAMTGGTPGQLSQAPFYRGGYSAVIAPVVASGLSPRTEYRLVLGVNALLAASLVPLLYLLLTRYFRAPSSAAVMPSVVGAAYPSATMFSQAALSENLLLPLTVVWLICFGAMLTARSERVRIGGAMASGACASGLYAVHGRMLVAVAVTFVAFGLLALLRRVFWRAAAAGIVVTTATLLAVQRLDAYLIRTNYGGHAPNEIGDRLSVVGHLGGVADFARNVLGEVWYVSVAGLGLLLLVAIADGPAFVRRMRRGEFDTPLVLVLLLLGLGLGLLVVSALSFQDLERADMLIYGRYVEVVMPPLLALALLRLARGSARLSVAATVGSLVALTAVVAALRTEVHPLRAANRWNVASLPFVTLRLGPPTIIGAAIVSILAIAVAAYLRGRRPGALAPLVLVAFLLISAVVEHNPVLSSQRSVYLKGWVSPGSVVHGSTVAYDTQDSDGISLYVYQWFMPRTREILYSGRRRPPAPYVIAPTAWGRREHGRSGGRQVWKDPGRNRAIFEIAPLG